ncbi:hypothetical protein NC652_030032 [Populus alba x Populus x berolinensis]|nr:hypothetical protein NC652_030032 [Populus alba x Populus x berolinensis]
MGIFYILVAERTPNPTNFLHSPIHIHEKMKVSAYCFSNSSSVRTGSSCCWPALSTEEGERRRLSTNNGIEL